jgi:UDP-3-O-[3-hydroxymyristoyl] glucosamine N-acyltransferase
MNLKLIEISKIIGADLIGDGEKEIKSVKSIEDCDLDSISYIENIDKLAKSKIGNPGCLIVSKKEKDKIPFKTNLLLVENPKLAFSKLLSFIERENSKKYEFGISDKSVISKNASVSSKCYIGPFCVIEDNAVIEDGVIVEANCYIGSGSFISANSRIYPNVVIRENVHIGSNCIIHSGSVIGGDGYGYIQTENGHQKIPQIGKVIIDDNVEIGSNVSIDRATIGETVIGKGTKIDNLVHIAHNVKIGSNCLIIAQAGIAGSTIIGNQVIIAGQAGISDHVIVEDNSIIMAKTGVMGHIKKGSILFGFIGRPRMEYMKIEAILSKLPEIYNFYKKFKRDNEKDDK